MAAAFLTSAAGSGVVGFLVRGIGSKLILYALVLYAWTSLIRWALSMVPSLNFNGAFAGLPDSFLYGFNYIDGPFLVAGYISMETTALLVRLRKG